MSVQIFLYSQWRSRLGFGYLNIGIQCLIWCTSLEDIQNTLIHHIPSEWTGMTCDGKASKDQMMYLVVPKMAEFRKINPLFCPFSSIEPKNSLAAQILVSTLSWISMQSFKTERNMCFVSVKKKIFITYFGINFGPQILCLNFIQDKWL